MKGYILYNPKAGNGRYTEDVALLEVVLEGKLEFYDMTCITNYTAFLRDIEENDYIVIAGGDGTLNRFVNDTAGIKIPQQILYFPIGSGNDFAHDLGKEWEDNPFPISAYLQRLPSVRVGGKDYHFLNGVGYGIDGYCCQVGDKLRKNPGKKVNYTAIAIKGLLFHYKPVKATVTVDGRQRTYDKVWLAPTMHGRFYGGGMMPAPDQDRTDKDNSLSVMVFHGSGKLRTLMIFPSIFKGTHIKHTKYVDILAGDEITVEFDRPTPLQIDGETILGVTSYTAKSAASSTSGIKISAAI